MPRYAVAAVRARPDGGPVRPWHAADLLDDDPADHEGEVVVSVCGTPMLRVFALEWGGIVEANGCADCRYRSQRES